MIFNQFFGSVAGKQEKEKGNKKNESAAVVRRH